MRTAVFFSAKMEHFQLGIYSCIQKFQFKSDRLGMNSSLAGEEG
jgi:hypothetical protein